jgi:CheY-like chemotaxis protein
VADGPAGPVVLLVDDDPAIRRAVAAGLELEGFEVVPASGGRAALEAAARVNPAVILLDLSMPDLDGLEVLERLRAGGDQVPVCVLSARDEVDDRVAGLQAGADDYVVKPFALEEVVARLHALLRRRPAGVDEALVVGDIRLDPRTRVARASWSSRAGSSSCCSCSCATPARSWIARACTRRSGATRSTPAPTWPTCSSATCGASSSRAATRASCTRSAAWASSCAPETLGPCAAFAVA